MLGQPLANGDDDVDISNLNIPEGSRDVIWRMLTVGRCRLTLSNPR